MHIVAMREGGYICKKPEIMMTREEIAAIDRECGDRRHASEAIVYIGRLEDVLKRLPTEKDSTALLPENWQPVTAK